MGKRTCWIMEDELDSYDSRLRKLSTLKKKFRLPVPRKM